MMKKGLCLAIALILAICLIFTVDLLPQYIKLSNNVKAGLIAGEAKIKIGMFNPKSVLTTLKNSIATSAEIMYVSTYTYSWISGNLNVKYASKIENQQALVREKIKSIALSINEKHNAVYDKILATNDYIQQNTKYDFIAAKEVEKSGYKLIPENLADSVTAYGVLVKNKGICQGYAAATSLLLTELGIDNKIQVGTFKDSPHAWVKVKIDNNYYNLDTTNNNIESPYAVFLSSDASLVEYTFENNIPSGKTENYNYYRRSGKYTFSMDGLLNILKKEYLNGNREIAIKCAPGTFINQETLINSIKKDLHFISVEFGTVSTVYYFKFK